ncbi:hypothetical protein Pcinc_019904 [Petrolisthes cinctipes]|uniref:Uncharacterized protein n=1 Tax=Petrolisthes cinctipes TaxID=88211 RepID=A0AAE1FJ92_PETCI|nr:hypothetical protein Pcinc_019904 [Petrolisthes cinctipes]
MRYQDFSYQILKTHNCHIDNPEELLRRENEELHKETACLKKVDNGHCFGPQKNTPDNHEDVVKLRKELSQANETICNMKVRGE